MLKMGEIYYITHEDGTCYYFSKGKPVLNAGKWHLPGGSLAWIEAELFEHLYPDIARLLAPDGGKNGVIEVRIKEGKVTEILRS